MTKVKAGPSSMGLPWLMSDEKADEGCARVEQTDHRLIFRKCPAGQFRKNKRKLKQMNGK
jgi:hypothetical protein